MGNALHVKTVNQSCTILTPHPCVTLSVQVAGVPGHAAGVPVPGEDGLALPPPHHVRHVVNVGQPGLGPAAAIPAVLRGLEAREEGAAVVLGVDQSVEDVVTRRPHHGPARAAPAGGRDQDLGASLPRPRRHGLHAAHLQADVEHRVAVRTEAGRAVTAPQPGVAADNIYVD